MKVLSVRNVYEALPQALQLLDEVGIRRNSRNGPVIMVPGGVTTVYSHPTERVVFWPQRDANPFFHLAEALWMLDGRDDVESLARYVKQVRQYSDDGTTFHGAYGARWRTWFGRDQLEEIAETLRINPNDRRQVLQMWSANSDLGRDGKDVPCNLVATFQKDEDGRLDLTVFCRSNDVIWGCYGANAVHFSILLEYMASEVGCSVGTYTQVSVNWHAYIDKYEELREIPRPNPFTYRDWIMSGLYQEEHVCVVPMEGVTREHIRDLLYEADSGNFSYGWTHPWCAMVQRVLKAHYTFKALPSPGRYREAFNLLDTDDNLHTADFIVAAREWIQRRWTQWSDKIQAQAERQ